MNYIVVGFIVATILMYALALVLSPETVGEGLKISYRTLTDPNIGLIPLIIAATLIMGLAQAAIPKDVITNFLGEVAGLKGIGLGTLLGIVIPGSAYAIFPLLGGLYKAGVGTIVAFTSAWSLVSLSRIPTEIPFLGAKIVAVRILVLVIFPAVSGILGQAAFSQISRFIITSGL